MSRKCQRLKSFLSHFGRYLIEYVTEHNSQIHDRLIYKRFRRAVRNAAVDHYRQWKLSSPKLWNLLQSTVENRLQGDYKSPTIKRVNQFLESDKPPPFPYIVGHQNKGKRKRILAKESNLIRSIPKKRRLNSPTEADKNTSKGSVSVPRLDQLVPTLTNKYGINENQEDFDSKLSEAP